MSLDLLRPWAVLLLPLPWLAWRFLSVHGTRSAVPLPESVWLHLQSLQAEAWPNIPRTNSGYWLRVLGWCALVVALAGPGRTGPDLLLGSGGEIVLAVDVSASMGEPLAIGDARRLDLVRSMLEQLLSDRAGDRVGLVAFAEQAYLIAPLTYDRDAIGQILAELEIGLAGRRTDLGQAIGLSLRTLQGSDGTRRSIVVITDGESNSGALTARDAASLAAAEGITLHLIGVSEETDAELSKKMQALAEMTGGTYLPVRNSEDLSEVAGGLYPGEPQKDRDVAAVRRRDLTWVALCIALGALVWREARRA